MSTTPVNFVDRSQWTVRKGALHDRALEESLHVTTPEERLAMVWPLTIEAYAMKGQSVAESRLPRHQLCITRRAS